MRSDTCWEVNFYTPCSLMKRENTNTNKDIQDGVVNVLDIFIRIKPKHTVIKIFKILSM